jgi:activator of HSP90 ATPase
MLRKMAIRTGQERVCDGDGEGKTLNPNIEIRNKSLLSNVKMLRKTVSWEEIMETKTIKQSVTFKTSPHEVYETLMDEKRHAEFTEGEAIISRKLGGKFSTFDGYAEGINVELEQDKKIVQTWRAEDWPEGHYSKATFALTKTEVGTRLTFTQTDVPEEFAAEIAQGWKDYYWGPMKKMLEG